MGGIRAEFSARLDKAGIGKVVQSDSDLDSEKSAEIGPNNKGSSKDNKKRTRKMTITMTMRMRATTRRKKYIYE